MSQQSLASGGSAAAEYSVYVYLYPQDIENGHTDWEMKMTTDCIQDAVNQAQTFHDSHSYKKVEIKKKYFDAKYERIIDATYKIFQEKKRVSRSARVLALLGLSGFASVGLLAIPFIGQF